MACIPHSANRSLVTVFALHLLASIPNAGSHAELSIEQNPWVEELFEPGVVVRDGLAVMPSEGPGWGVVLKREWLLGSERKVSAWRE